ncbi:hypothetical protein JCM17960_32250 [Magnetospira thiophila]
MDKAKLYVFSHKMRLILIIIGAILISGIGIYTGISFIMIPLALRNGANPCTFEALTYVWGDIPEEAKIASPFSTQSDLDRKSESELVAKLPGSDILHAYDLFEKGECEGARSELFYRVLNDSADLTNENRKWVDDSDWRASFKIMFGQVIVEVNDLEAGDSAVPYRIWKKSLDERGIEGLRPLDFTLLSLAKKKGNKDAAFDMAVYHFIEYDPADTQSIELGFDRLRWLAFDGHEKAMWYLVDAYTSGARIKRNDPAAYYWLIKGQQHGIEVEDAKRRIEPHLSPEDRQKIAYWMQHGGLP